MGNSQLPKMTLFVLASGSRKMGGPINATKTEKNCAPMAKGGTLIV